MCYLIERDLVDQNNENSCVITYYEIGQDVEDLYRPLTNSIMMNIMKEPFFDDLRTKQQLGYVVASNGVDIREVIGCKFIV